MRFAFWTIDSALEFGCDLGAATCANTSPKANKRLKSARKQKRKFLITFIEFARFCKFPRFFSRWLEAAKSISAILTLPTNKQQMKYKQRIWVKEKTILYCIWKDRASMMSQFGKTNRLLTWLLIRLFRELAQFWFNSVGFNCNNQNTSLIN